MPGPKYSLPPKPVLIGPPVYKPAQAVPTMQRNAVPPARAAQPMPRLIGPPVYRPQRTPVQPKLIGPPVYRPQPPAAAAQPRRAAAPPVYRPQASPVQPKPPQSNTAIQRKIGFEFETHWLMKAPGGLLGSDDAVIEGAGWHVSPDMRAPSLESRPTKNFFGQNVVPKYQGFGNVEFITDAFEEDQTGLEGLKLAMEEIEIAVKKLQGGYDVKINQALGGGIRWGEFLREENEDRKAKRNEIVIEDTTNGPTAAPQITAGVKLAQVATILYRMGNPNNDIETSLTEKMTTEESRELERKIIRVTARNAQILASDAGRRHPEWTPLEVMEYSGAVAHLAMIVFKAGIFTDLEQAKYVSTVLSRTNFGLLPDHIRQEPGFWQDVVLASTREQDTLGRVFKDANVSKLSFAEWSQAISLGRDPVSWGQSSEHRWDPQQVGPQGNRGLGHVFEFRGVGEGLHVSKWKEFALSRFRYFCKLNASINSQPPKPLEFQPPTGLRRRNVSKEHGY
jgi:hypothetical protein